MARFPCPSIVNYDPAGSTKIEHDGAGRVVATDHSTDGITKYTWDRLPNDPSPNGMGHLVESVSPAGIKTTYGHDPHGRLGESQWDIGLESFAVSVDYDQFGRIDTVHYPKVDGIDPVSIRYTYNTSNYLREVRNTSQGTPGTPIWLVGARNADDAMVQAHFGYDVFANPNAVPALSLSRTHYDTTGRLKTAVATKPSSSTPLYDMLYQYYDNGQVKQRVDSAAHRTEVFEYDHLDRLNRWSLQGPKLGALRETNYGYDVIGNLTEVYVDGLLKTKNYYDGSRPHALEWSDDTDLGSDDLDYDGIGRQKAGGGRDTVEYTSFNLPTLVVTPEGKTTFQYDAQHSRVKKETDTETTISIAGLYERRGSGSGKYQHVFRVPGGEGPVAELVYDEGDPSGKVNTRFIAADMLGSPSLVTDGAGTVLERLFFEPFGQRVNASGLASAAAATTQHGFTDHWHDDELGLIDMRGRVYDPRSRRFLTPDPLVPNPLFGQAYNRYSYVYNDPLNHTDPSGFDPETGGGGGVPTGSSGGEHGGCAAGDCPWGGSQARSVVLRSDAEGWQDFGCPEATSKWGSGPCPSGQVGGGCGGAVPSAAEIRAALAATIAHNNAVWEAGEPLRKEVEKWYKSGKSSREVDELMWQVGGGQGPAPPGFAVWGVNSWGNAGHTVGVDQVSTALAIGSGVVAFNSWLGGGLFWRALLADSRGGSAAWGAVADGPVTLYHGTTASSAARIVESGLRPGRDGAVFLAQDYATAAHFANEAVAARGALSGTVIKFSVPADVAAGMERGVLGAARGARPLDIVGGSGYEVVLSGNQLAIFNSALRRGAVGVTRLRLGFAPGGPP